MKKIRTEKVPEMKILSGGWSLFALLALLFVLPAAAQATTLTVESDHLDIWEQKQEALFTGSVHLVREDFELFCDSLRAFYRSAAEGGGIDHALATGHVRLIQGDKQGTSDSAVIDNRKQIVTLKGNAVMQQEGGRVAGETIVHDLTAKTTEVMQGGNGRVTLRIDEKQMDVMPASDKKDVPPAGGELPDEALETPVEGEQQP